jgi:hypothetical protein
VLIDNRHHRRRLLRHGAAWRDPYWLPQKNAGFIVRWRQPALRHPDDPELVARGPHQALRAHYQEIQPG